MIVVITNSTDVTADFMCSRLERSGISFLRLDTDSLTRSVGISVKEGRIELIGPSGLALTPDDVGCVWLRRPKDIAIDGPDSAEKRHTALEWAEALEAFLELVPRPRWINHPSNNKAASLKLRQLVDAKRFGLTIPDTLVTQKPGEVLAFCAQKKSVVTKTLSGGYVEHDDAFEDTQIFTSRVTSLHLEEVDVVRLCPTILQEEIAKDTDVRLTVVDGALTAVALSRLDSSGKQVTDIRRDNMDAVTYCRIEVPPAVARSVLDLMAHYGLRFAAVDFAVDGNGRWVFFEVNPGGQWAWLDIVGTTDIAGDLVLAMKRDLVGRPMVPHSFEQP